MKIRNKVSWACAGLAGIMSFNTSAMVCELFEPGVGEPTVVNKFFTRQTANFSQFVELGTAVAVGDFNNDGTPDLAMSAPNEPTRRGVMRAGSVSIFLNVSGLPTQVGVRADEQANQVENVLLEGVTASEEVGQFMAVGDFNNDNIDDLAITSQSKLYVVLGRASFESTISLGNELSADIQTSFALSSRGQVAAGDVNGDGIDDIVVTQSSQVSVLFGGGDMTFDAAITRSNDTNDFLPQGIAIGDFNGDNVADIAIGLPGDDLTNLSLQDVGRVYIVPGSANFADVDLSSASSLLTIINGESANYQTGVTLAAGDVNGDGVGDLLIGAPEANSASGRAYIVPGSRRRLASTIELFQNSSITVLRMSDLSVGGSSAKVGQTLLAQDLNADNIVDIIVAGPGRDWVNVLYGRSQLASEYLLDSASDIFFTGEPNTLGTNEVSTLRGGIKLGDALMGTSVAVADFNRDGQPDIVFGGPDSTDLIFPQASAGKDRPDGYVAVVYSPVAKVQTPGAALDLASGILNLPEVAVAGIGSFTFQMQFITIIPGGPVTSTLRFQLNPVTIAPSTVSLCQPARAVIAFDGGFNRDLLTIQLAITAFDVGGGVLLEAPFGSRQVAGEEFLLETENGMVRFKETPGHAVGTHLNL
ncbi:MAG: FG-GAP-like repeat-containing protein [Pseudomonadota bacterium]